MELRGNRSRYDAELDSMDGDMAPVRIVLTLPCWVPAAETESFEQMEEDG